MNDPAKIKKWNNEQPVTTTGQSQLTLFSSQIRSDPNGSCTHRRPWNKTSLGDKGLGEEKGQKINKNGKQQTTTANKPKPCNDETAGRFFTRWKVPGRERERQARGRQATRHCDPGDRSVNQWGRRQSPPPAGVATPQVPNYFFGLFFMILIQ